MTNFNELNQTNNLPDTSTGPVNSKPIPMAVPEVENPTAAGDAGDKTVNNTYVPDDIAGTQQAVDGNFDNQTRAGDHDDKK